MPISGRWPNLIALVWVILLTAGCIGASSVGTGDAGPTDPPASSARMGTPARPAPETPSSAQTRSRPSATATATPSATPEPTNTATPSPSPSPEPTPVPTATPSPTPDPYFDLSIEALAIRDYGGGDLQIEEVLGANATFTRTLITFPSDGLTIYGFMNEPVGEGPFPVVLVLHGYVDPAVYNTLTYTTRYADDLARTGYLVIHPNFRNWPPSDSGPEDLRVGQAVDVLNLIAVIKAQGGQPGPLAKADPDRIGLWGHSMGGGITQRVVTVSPDVDAAVVYGAMSGDETRNHQRILYFTNGATGLWDEPPPDDALRRISPIFHLRRITAPVSIHHGGQDDQVPLAWSEELCRLLQALEKPVECFTYLGQPHTFVGEGDQLFMQRVRDFFDRTLQD